MKIYAKIATAVIVGLASLGTLVYFYDMQRNFSRDYKEMVSNFHALQNMQGKVTEDVVKSSLFTYYNQDVIASRLQELQQLHKKLERAPILETPDYTDVRNKIALISIALERHTDNVDKYLMLNAGIKNSMIFLSAHNERSADYFSHEESTHDILDHIVHHFANARRMFDADYLKNLPAVLTHLHSSSYSEKQQQYLETFLLHANFITANFPEYLDTFNLLMDDANEKVIDLARKSYEETAQADVQQLDNFVILFLSLLSVALFWVIYLVLRSETENRRLKELQQMLEYTATHDGLTTLLSRREFERVLPERAEPTLLLINIDRFKHVNDFYGTDVGNKILQEIALLIQLPAFQQYDPTYFRLGGDDFGILLENIDEQHAKSHASTLVSSIASHPFIINDLEIYITVSLAINNIPSIFEHADMALKHLKTHPSGNIIVFSNALGLKEKIQSNLETASLIKSAIANDCIKPFFQPIVNLRTGKTEKYEALARIILDDGTILMPADFLDVAAQTQLYRQITRIMINKTMEHFANLPYRFSINMSMRDLLDEELMKMLTDVLAKNSQTAKRLDFELLESEDMHDLSRVKHFIREMKSFGCQISLDDFGSGYSNFAYLVALPIDTLKIDGSLINQIKSDPKRLQTVQTIVDYAHNLGMKTIAEFVEDEQTANMLHSLGVIYGQGYFFGKPSENIEHQTGSDT